MPENPLAQLFYGVVAVADLKWLSFEDKGISQLNCSCQLAILHRRLAILDNEMLSSLRLCWKPIMFHWKCLFGKLARNQHFKRFEDYELVKNDNVAELLSLLSKSGLGKATDINIFTFY